jgi:hypothetical protein
LPDLSRQQIKIVREKILNGGVKTPELIEDLLDHLCLAVEKELDQGLSFETAVERTFNNLDEEELKLTEMNTQTLLEGKKIYYPNLSESFGLIVLLFVFSTIAGFCIFALFQGNFGSIFPLALMVSNGMAFGGVIAMAVHWIRESQKNRVIFSFKPLRLYVYTLIFGIVIVSNFWLEPLHHFGWEAMTKPFLKTLNQLFQVGIVTTLLVGMVNIVLVELLLRGVILNGLLKTLTPAKAIISCALFGVVINFFAFPLVAFATHLVQGWLYWKTKSLLSVIASGGFAMVIGTSTVFFLGKPSEPTFTWQEVINNVPVYWSIVAVSLVATYILFRILNEQLSRS